MGRYTILVVASVAIIGIGFWWMGGTGMGTSTASTGTGGAGVPMVKVTVPETISDNARIGKMAFDAKCAECHGPNAAGQEGIAPPLVHEIYEPGHHGDMSFIIAAKNGVRAHHWRFGNMPPVEGVTDGDVKMIVTYVRELQRANGIN